MPNQQTCHTEGRFRLEPPVTAGPWTIHESRELLHNQWARIAIDRVTRPDGLPGEHVVVGIKPGVCVLAVEPDGTLLLTREYHYAIGRESIEGVSGGRDTGADGRPEPPEQCAHRELQEELGLRAGRLERLMTVDPFTSLMVSPTVLFVARELTPVPAAPEGTERIETVRIPLPEAVQMVREGAITHAPTCIGILWLALEPAQAETPAPAG